MTTDESLRCENKSDLKSLGGYRYEADPDVVNESSRIDVQMKTVEIFLDNAVNQFSESQEVVFRSAFDVYKTSLRSIARDTNREVVPVFASFQRYFALDDYYADTMIVSALIHFAYVSCRSLTLSNLRRQMHSRREGCSKGRLLIRERGSLHSP